MASTDYPLPWRLGTKLDHSHYGAVTLYDGTPLGDGGRPGRFIGVMFTLEAAQIVIAAVNGFLAALHSDLDFPERLRQLVTHDYADEDMSAILDNQVGLLALADALDEARRITQRHPGTFPELELRLNRLRGFA